ncbi:hypothetical protein BOTBODRAFT_49150 [Botryobasidium botryosum FD-172 SS1]|uniref:Uncharacterized protein n=1 Tax=Botryobasidium botryosum (strain FD-172 SS1) TaxID=930990 RepID=A0A067LU72_BOTB1|nr:hypothetical protein BOTBODRAFT_49150 [Botryobasidium botryosum FD-172 SS1]
MNPRAVLDTAWSLIPTLSSVSRSEPPAPVHHGTIVLQIPAPRETVVVQLEWIGPEETSLSATVAILAAVVICGLLFLLESHLVATTTSVEEPAATAARSVSAPELDIKNTVVTQHEEEGPMVLRSELGLATVSSSSSLKMPEEAIERDMPSKVVVEADEPAADLDNGTVLVFDSISELVILQPAARVPAVSTTVPPHILASEPRLTTRELIGTFFTGPVSQYTRTWDTEVAIPAYPTPDSRWLLQLCTIGRGRYPTLDDMPWRDVVMLSEYELQSHGITNLRLLRITLRICWRVRHHFGIAHPEDQPLPPTLDVSPYVHLTECTQSWIAAVGARSQRKRFDEHLPWTQFARLTDAEFHELQVNPGNVALFRRRIDEVQAELETAPEALLAARFRQYVANKRLSLPSSSAPSPSSTSSPASSSANAPQLLRTRVGDHHRRSRSFSSAPTFSKSLSMDAGPSRSRAITE